MRSARVSVDRSGAGGRAGDGAHARPLVVQATALDIVLREVQERISSLGVATPEEFSGILRTRQMNEFLRSRVDRLPQVETIFLVGANGARVNYSLAAKFPDGNLSDRDYAPAFCRAGRCSLFISAPAVSRGTGTSIVVLARRVNGPNGGFLGMVVGAVPLMAFHRPSRPSTCR